MSVLDTLTASVIAAPMAGGPSTPALVNAVAAAGGFGFLAAGYLSAAELAEQMRRTRQPYGVNLFAPQAPPKDVQPVADYAQRLAHAFESVGVLPGDYRTVDPTDGWREKLDLVCQSAREGWGPAVVSTTFGLPGFAELRRLHQAGIEVWASVTSPAAADAAVRLGVDALVVQGPEAGGHRATFTVEETPCDLPLQELIRRMPQVPLIAAGGIDTGEPLRWPGVRAIACGTAFLLANEAGTQPTQRSMLLDATTTAPTRAYSGRIARGVYTNFMANNEDAPAVYPHVNSMMGPLRAASKSYAAAWAGTGVGRIRQAPAASIIASVLEGWESQPQQG